MTGKEKTLLHIRRVNELLGICAAEFIGRGIAHDASKLEEPEAEYLEKLEAIIQAEGNVPYGSPEYSKRTEIIRPMVTHHHANNSHHPEYYRDGVSGMNLFDVMEMVMDWKAASERGEQPDIGLDVSFAKFGITGQLAEVIRHTVERFGW